jgi:hypothetical protein
MKGDGRIFQRHRRADCPNRGKEESIAKCECSWWIAYYRAGKEVRESAKSEKAAKDLLKQRRAEIFAGARTSALKRRRRPSRSSSTRSENT